MFGPDQLKNALGIDEMNPKATSLTPLNQIREGNFTPRDLMALLGVLTQESSDSLPKDIDRYIKLALQQYQKYHDGLRDRMMEHEKGYELYGKQTQLIDTIGISPAGPEGRWLMDFRTTGVLNESDHRVNVTTMLLDVKSGEVKIIDADRFGGFLEQPSK